MGEQKQKRVADAEESPLSQASALTDRLDDVRKRKRAFRGTGDLDEAIKRQLAQKLGRDRDR